MNRYSFLLLPALALAWASLLPAQIDPENVQVISYFPQVADGGPASQKWVTSFTFLNPHASIRADALVNFYGNDGTPLALDFGAGPTTQTKFSLPPQGSVTFVSTGASANIVTGWAVAASTLPLQGTVQYRYSVNGTAQQGVSVEATPASIQFVSPVTSDTGIAVANPTGGSIGVTIIVLDTNGGTIANSSMSLGPSVHQAFTLKQVFPSLGSGFRGSVQISGSTDFVALTISDDGGVLSGMPPSGLAWPQSQFERTWKVWQKILNAAFNDPLAAPALSKVPALVIDPNTQEINSFALGDTVHIFWNMAELMSDSDGELAFFTAHELGHVIQSHSGTLPSTQLDLKFVPNDLEWDADRWGLILSLEAGYDPWSGAGALGRLYTAANLLLAPNFDGITGDVHGSLVQRIDKILTSIDNACSAAPQLCAQYKAVFHPHFPSSAPLDRKGATPK